MEPWSGQIFGEGGVEKMLQDKVCAQPPVISGVKGNVIMPKLGNATAKCVTPSYLLMHIQFSLNLKSGARSSDVETTVRSTILLERKTSLMCFDRHTTTLRYPEARTRSRPLF